jgi:hypothetical protein
MASFTRTIPDEKYEGPEGLKALIVEVLRYPALVQAEVQAQVQATDELYKPLINEDGSPKMIPVINEDGTPHTIPATNEDGSPKMITNPISENQFVKICIIENDKKFFRNLRNIQRNKQVAIAGANDFEVT